jgi:FlaA1/EpsC-like NDP-sugar epimerase
MNILKLISRKTELFEQDIKLNEEKICNIISSSKFLVLGGAGSIGQAVVKEIFVRNPLKLHIVDISENNLVELVRDIRSDFGYINGDFRTFAIDIGSVIYDTFFNNDGDYDFVLNLSALKHVRSEKDKYTLMRLIEVNILNTIKTINQCKTKGVKHYFCVSSDKAANPVNMMGASKRIMELFLNRPSNIIPISTARFANVAFSDGSLLESFNQRVIKKQPIVAPNDIKRYFVTPKEAGQLCLMSCLLGSANEIFFPKLSEKLHLIKFSDIARTYLNEIGYTPIECSTEEEARNYFKNNNSNNLWPCYFTNSNTTGEKYFEEFFVEGEDIDLNRFDNIGVIKQSFNNNEILLDDFFTKVNSLLNLGKWEKGSLVQLFQQILVDFNHEDLGKYLDDKM